MKKDGALTRKERLTLKDEAIETLKNAKAQEQEKQQLVKEGKYRIEKIYDKHLHLEKIKYVAITND